MILWNLKNGFIYWKISAAGPINLIKKLNETAGNNIISIWQTAGGSIICDLTDGGHLSEIRSLEVLPDGTLASSGCDNFILIWNVPFKQVLFNLTGHTRCVNILKVSNDGLYLLSGSQDSSIKIWVLATRKLLKQYAHSQSVNAIESLPGGRFASASDDFTIKIFQIDKEITTKNDHTSKVLCLKLLPNENYFASGAFDSNIIIYEFTGFTVYKRLSGHRSPIISLDSSVFLSNHLLMSSSKDVSIKIWDTMTGRILSHVSSGLVGLNYNFILLNKSRKLFIILK